MFSSVISFCIGQPPDLVQLLKVDIPQLVGMKYKAFGTHLLDDKTGKLVEIIVHNHPQDAEGITMQILQDWIAGKGKPWTWKTLILTLKDCIIVDWTNLLPSEC